MQTLVKKIYIYIIFVTVTVAVLKRQKGTHACSVVVMDTSALSAQLTKKKLALSAPKWLSRIFGAQISL